MSVESTRAVMMRYLESHHSDLSMMADDVVFTSMATGDEHRGVDALRNMLHYIYHVAFDATAELENLIVTDQQAVLRRRSSGSTSASSTASRRQANRCACRCAWSTT